MVASRSAIIASRFESAASKRCSVLRLTFAVEFDVSESTHARCHLCAQSQVRSSYESVVQDALRRRHRRDFNSGASKPRKSKASCSSRYSTDVSLGDSLGHAKVPSSKRLASTHTPDSSYTSTFIRLRPRLQKKNRSRELGLAPNRSRANPLKPLKDLRMSVAPVTRKIRPPEKVNTLRLLSPGA